MHTRTLPTPFPSRSKLNDLYQQHKAVLEERQRLGGGGNGGGGDAAALGASPGGPGGLSAERTGGAHDAMATL